MHCVHSLKKKSPNKTDIVVMETSRLEKQEPPGTVSLQTCWILSHLLSSHGVSHSPMSHSGHSVVTELQTFLCHPVCPHFYSLIGKSQLGITEKIIDSRPALVDMRLHLKLRTSQRWSRWIESYFNPIDVLGNGGRNWDPETDKGWVHRDTGRIHKAIKLPRNAQGY